MKKPILTGQGLSKQFGQQNEYVLNKIDITIYQEDFTIIMGASGSGKSTLLYALSGMDGISGGRVVYQTQEISGYNEKQMAALRAHDFGFIFQQTHLVSHLSLFENVVVAGYIGKGASEKALRARAQGLLSQMQVEGSCHRLPAFVSGGEAQRAAIARAMMHAPTLLFADEPTGALNRKNSEQVLDLLCGLHTGGQSIVMVTHDIKAAIRATRLLYLEDGAITAQLDLPPFSHASASQREAAVGHWLTAAGW